MPVSILHANQTALPDGGDATRVRPSDWNAEHAHTMTSNRLLGRSIGFPSTGEIEEISLSADFTIAGGVLGFSSAPEFSGINLTTPLAISMGGHAGTTPAEALANLQLEIVGGIFYFPMTSAPLGFLKANGAAVSRTTYSALFSKIGTSYGAGNGSTTFNLPDVRGDFLRGLDEGRGVDVGRALGTRQLSDVGSHTHTYSGSLSTDPGHSHGIFDQHGQTGDAGVNGRYAGATNGVLSPIGARAAGNHNHTWSGSTAGATGHSAGESRPRNIALLACVKY